MKMPSKSFRSATSSPATLMLDDGTAVSCVVRNLSAGGAKVELAADDVVPDRFRIVASDLRIDADADVVWRQPPLMGVQFLTRQATAASRAAEPKSIPAQQPIALGDITAPARAVAGK